MKITYLIFFILILISGCTSTEKKSPVKSISLKQTRWEITSINSENVDDSRIYILLGEEGKLTGNAGCNTMSGVYETADGKISFKNIITTKMACSDLDKENRFLKALQSADSYRIDGTNLILFSLNTEVLKFGSKIKNQ